MPRTINNPTRERSDGGTDPDPAPDLVIELQGLEAQVLLEFALIQIFKLVIRLDRHKGAGRHIGRRQHEVIRDTGGDVRPEHKVDEFVRGVDILSPA